MKKVAHILYIIGIVSNTAFCMKNPSEPTISHHPEIYNAIVTGDYKTVKRFFNNHPQKINSFIGHSDYLCTPLYAAVISRRINITTFLLDTGADPNIESANGLLPLAMSMDPFICWLLLERGADPNRTDQQKNTIFAVAIGLGISNRKCIELMLSRGANPNSYINGQSVLTTVALRGNEEEVALLLNKGASVNNVILTSTLTCDRNIRVLLQKYCNNGKICWCPKDAEITHNNLCDRCILNCLYRGIYRDKINEVKIIISRYPWVVEMYDSEGEFPLYKAVKSNAKESTYQLLFLGASAHQKTLSGESLWHALPSKKIAKLLIQSGSGNLINETDNNNVLPLEKALNLKAYANARMLIETSFCKY